MRITSIVPALVAVTMLSLPAAASAQQGPDWQNNNGNVQQHDNGGDGRDREDRRDRGNNGYGRSGNNGNGNYGNRGAISGVVSSFSAFNLQLGNGPHINLHQGTVINPTGTTLQPGMRVQIYGHSNNDGSYEADQINVVGNNNGNRRNNGNYGGYGNNGNYGSNGYYGNSGNILSSGNIGSILGQFGL